MSGIPSLSGSGGAAGPATSGNISGSTQLGNVGGISSPIVIGGYKTATAAAQSAGGTGGSTIPSWVWYVGAAVAAVGLIVWLRKKK